MAVPSSRGGTRSATTEHEGSTEGREMEDDPEPPKWRWAAVLAHLLGKVAALVAAVATLISVCKGIN